MPKVTQQQIESAVSAMLSVCDEAKKRYYSLKKDDSGEVEEVSQIEQQIRELSSDHIRFLLEMGMPIDHYPSFANHIKTMLEELKNSTVEQLSNETCGNYNNNNATPTISEDSDKSSQKSNIPDVQSLPCVSIDVLDKFIKIIQKSLQEYALQTVNPRTLIDFIKFFSNKRTGHLDLLKNLKALFANHKIPQNLERYDLAFRQRLGNIVYIQFRLIIAELKSISDQLNNEGNLFSSDLKIRIDNEIKNGEIITAYAKHIHSKQNQNNDIINSETPEPLLNAIPYLNDARSMVISTINSEKEPLINSTLNMASSNTSNTLATCKNHLALMNNNMLPFNQDRIHLSLFKPEQGQSSFQSGSRGPIFLPPLNQVRMTSLITNS